MTAQLPTTGERFLPEAMAGEIAVEHLHRYHVAAKLAADLDVLDIASGEGYGAALLASVARSVIGVDIDANAVEFATEKYAASVNNLRFVVGECSLLPLSDASVDLVVSFETIEHHDQHDEMFAEIKRVLRPGGVLVMSSPDRHEYSDVPGYANPYHVKELYRKEFEALLSRAFRFHRLYGQRARYASTLFPIVGAEAGPVIMTNYLVREEAAGEPIVESPGAIAARYLVAVASDRDNLPSLAVGTFASLSEEHRIAHVDAELQSARTDAALLRQQATGWQNRNRQAAEEASRLRNELQEWRKHAQALEDRVAGQEMALRELAERHVRQLKDAHALGVKQLADSESDELARLRATLVERDAQLQTIVRSLSWRVTRPLRVGRRIAAKLKGHRGLGERSRKPGPQEPRVTDDFDEQYYLKRYTDVADSGIDPYHHFVTFGRPEGRSGKPPKLLLRQTTGTQHEAKQKSVLVVCHEATRTGAPILAWNICRELRGQYQVVALLLGGGPLVRMFDEVCDAVAGPYSPMDRSALALAGVVGELCQRFKFEFAIVNSIVSRAVLQPLAEQSVPSVLLIHEFFKFHCSRDELVDALAWAGQTVFSAQIVRQGANIERTRPAAARAYILPQGKSLIPADSTLESDKRGSNRSTATVDVIERKLMNGRSVKPFVVLGAGTIEYRKGVDLFIAAAAEIRRIAPKADILMIWVGRIVEGYRQYADFVATQVEQIELGDRILFIDETPDLEALYRLADVCFISSRLDPLPNIALDAMTAGLPVLSFERATGVAENLKGDPLLEQCILPFMNVEEAARRIVALYNEPGRRQELSNRTLALANERFEMSHYAASLANLAALGQRLVKRARKDEERLINGDEFAEWFFLPPGSRKSRQEAIREFVKAAQSGIYVRKPAPGFYPHLYAVSHDLGADVANPFVQFIEAGRPSGVWQEPLLDVSQPAGALSSGLRIGVHIHAFYPDLLADIVRRLSMNQLQADLLVSAPSSATAEDCRRLLDPYSLGSATIHVVPNKGRDIGPFVTEFGDALQQYDIVGHFHTKKSVHVDPNSRLVADWVNHLMETLLGGEHCAGRSIVSAFADDPGLGLVFADDPHLIGWDLNLPFAEPMGERLGLSALPNQFFPFPVGTMFWARPAALKPLFELGLAWEDYPVEPLPIDGSMLHALERLLPSIVEQTGYGRRLTFAPGISR
ncbi:rhamnan synthesis F family protein [Trinickia sp. EG282A]|uniref:rhamnan synthesis F family protein n=1 Tax=Trinickia sp. EG282A TaxID=3237013 RepID=UPI0034D37D56